ncbi:LysM peptidoglycan-binding domain-containing protein [Stappia indica]|uniref:Nucleoid-associated protein YgaU, contains BON and LysM domains n=1 Tax=Stappia indica TaxID=538381 RepID=A0A285RPC8_9HYPH|nr:LysM peptidoglycan-binding domain-containing protein [Stappia indica]SOB95973.1 Nucleoid-associated protein YgaU, contains BON and LysM domains [Stappia indica]
MSQKLIIQVLVLLGLAGAGAAGYYLSQKDAGPGQQTAGAPPAGDVATQTTTTEQPATTEEPKAGETPAQTTNIGGKSVEERLAAVPSFDLMRVEPDGSAVVAGRSEAGAIIALLANGEVIGRGIANAAGEFAIVLDQPLKPGAHAVTLETRDADGKVLNESQQSMAVSVPEDSSKGEVLVMLNEPGAPSQVLQKPQQVADAGTASSDQPAPQQTADASAPAAQGAPDTAGSQTVAAATPQPADEQPAPTAEAQTQSQAQAQPEPQAAPQTAGSNDTAAEQQVAAAPQTSDTGTAPATGDQPAATGGNASSDTAQASDTATAPTTDQATDPATPTVTVEAVETENEKVFVAGSGQPNRDVRVYLDNQLVGEAKTDAKGRWLLETEGEVKPGEVAVRADQVGTTGEGDVTARAEVTFEKVADEAIILRPVALSGEAGSGSGASGDAGTRQIPSVIIRTGDNLWTISQRRYGDGVRYTTIYQANKDQIRNPDLIYPGQVFMIPEGDRNWPAPRSTGG